MNIFYAVAGLISLLLVVNLYRPVYRHPKGIVVSFLFGWLAGELPFHLIAAGLVLSLILVGTGNVYGMWGLLGLAAFVASWAGLLRHAYVADRSGVRLRDVLLRELGPEFTPLYSGDEPMELDRICHPAMLHLKPHRQPGVELIRNIVYEEVDGLRLKLDIRRPACTRESISESSAPVLFQIHGGAWTYGYGSKNEQGLPLMDKLVHHGWVCVSVDYRLSPQATFPDHIIDCKKALVWVKQHIAEYGGNPDFIVATGGSAGGHLCSLLALTPNLASLQPGFEDQDTHVQACVPFYGIYDFTDRYGLQRHDELKRILAESILKADQQQNPELYRLASPLEHISESAPPFLIIQGDRDTLVSDREARMFAAELKKISRQPVIYGEIALAQHAFEIFPSVRTERVLNQVVGFLQYVRKK